MESNYEPFTLPLVRYLKGLGYTHILMDPDLEIPVEEVLDEEGSGLYNDVLFIGVVPLRPEELIDNEMDAISLDSPIVAEKIMDAAYFYHISKDYLKK